MPLNVRDRVDNLLQIEEGEKGILESGDSKYLEFPMPAKEELLSVSLGQSTRKGRRDQNEDFYACLTPNNHQLLHRKGITAIIADGAGDNGEGLDASHYAVNGFFSDYYSTPDTWSIKRSGEQVLRSLNRWLYARTQDNVRSKGYVTTFSAVVLCGRWLHTFHIGDTRIYLWRRNALELLTRDHCAVGRRDQLTRALGLDSELILDYKALPMEAGDVLLLTTDGLHKFLNRSAIREALLKKASLQQKADILSGQAESTSVGASPDNITCQLLEVQQLPPPEYSDLERESKTLLFPPLLNPGEELDGYVIDELAGHGSMGLAYNAREKAGGKEVVLKCPREELVRSTEMRERLQREEWAGLKVHSPYLMKAYVPSRLRSKYYYLVLEKCKGIPLREQMEQGRLFSIHETVEIGKQLCRGLDHLHRLEIIHRDLKPDSVLLSPAGAVKIIDYGIVKIANSRGVTLAGNKPQLLGSPSYLAPEIFKTTTGSPATDLYALGVTLYEMLTGKYPYGEVLDHRVHTYGPYVSLLERKPGVPVWLDDAIRKSVALELHRRYHQASEFLYDLENPRASSETTKFVPLMQKNPLLFWKSAALVLFLLNLIWLGLAALKKL